MTISKSRIAGVLFLLLAFVGASPTAFAAKFKVKDGPTIDVWGLLQYGFEQYDRKGGGSNRDGLEFDADRVRFGTRMKWGAWDGGLHFDANKNTERGSRRATTLDSFIRDAFIRYKFSDAAKLQLGQFKTPVGMGYTLSGTRLPLIKRTFTARLTLDRSIGAMLSGRNIGGDKETGGFGYDVGIFNTADRSKAVSGIDGSQKGDDHSFAARLMYDYGKMLHLQAYYGEIENAGGPDDGFHTCAADADAMTAGYQPSRYGCTMEDQELDSEDYKVMGAGMLYKNGPMRFRAEYIDGKDVRGRDGYDEQAWYLTAGYKFTDVVEGVVRYQDVECDNCGGAANADEDLNRLEFGLNFYLGPNDRNGRVQLNYVKVGGDEEDYSGRAAPDDRYDAILGQVQLYF